MKRRAISLTEILVGLAILTVLAGVTHLSPDLYKHTAKREAERIYNKLSSCMLKADRTRISFKVYVESEQLRIVWQKSGIAPAQQTENFPAKTGCSYSWNGPDTGMLYSHVLNTYTGQTATITITGKGSPYYIVISAVGGRMRLSDTPPSST